MRNEVTNRVIYHIRLIQRLLKGVYEKQTKKCNPIKFEIARSFNIKSVKFVSVIISVLGTVGKNLEYENCKGPL